MCTLMSVMPSAIAPVIEIVRPENETSFRQPEVHT